MNPDFLNWGGGIDISYFKKQCPSVRVGDYIQPDVFRSLAPPAAEFAFMVVGSLDFFHRCDRRNSHLIIIIIIMYLF